MVELDGSHGSGPVTSDGRYIGSESHIRYRDALTVVVLFMKGGRTFPYTYRDLDS
jgi:hypothetical protein